MSVENPSRGSFTIHERLGYVHSDGFSKRNASPTQRAISTVTTSKSFPYIAGWSHQLPDATNGDDLGS